MVGTGGIGHGSFFLLDGPQTLGREESRSGRFLDRRDYCKIHIISHYLKILLGDALGVFPVGRVGDDDAGRRLDSEMRAVGIDMRFVHQAAGVPTLYSFCLVYPDGSGGNLTTADSASSTVDSAAVEEAEPLLSELGAGGIALAVPEVPLPARRRLLELATVHGLFRAASFAREEMTEVRSSRLLDGVDLCAMNLEEATAAAGLDGEPEPKRVLEVIAREYPQLAVSVTCGGRGSWLRDESGATFDPAIPVDVAGTTGAGDAHFSGILAGLAAGLDFRGAQQLGTTVAAASVTSVHTIHPDLTAALLRRMALRRERTSAGVAALLDIGNGGS